MKLHLEISFAKCRQLYSFFILLTTANSPYVVTYLVSKWQVQLYTGLVFEETPLGMYMMRIYEVARIKTLGDGDTMLVAD